ncbi:MAG: hypothetical protein ACRC6M_14355 [Microcystaceae cyanobacterium]
MVDTFRLCRLLEELQKKGVKCDREKVIAVEQLSDGRIVFLEEGNIGNRGSGLKHILERHEADFYNKGISKEDIPILLMSGILQNQVVGWRGKRQPRQPIYEIIFKERVYYVAITISNNGYIVGANPVSFP